MKISIKIRCKGEVFNSSTQDVNTDELNECRKLIKLASEGKVTCFTLNSDNCEHYFGKKVLEESIITIINH